MSERELRPVQMKLENQYSSVNPYSRARDVDTKLEKTQNIVSKNDLLGNPYLSKT